MDRTGSRGACPRPRGRAEGRHGRRFAALCRAAPGNALRRAAGRGDLHAAQPVLEPLARLALPDASGRPGRSEEQTSELQSLMRSSYAAFCFKKKTKLNI